MTKPKMPPGLGARGRAFWRDVLATWEVNRDELELLTEICRTLDLLDELRDAISRDGMTVAGSEGQPRAHPAVSQVTASRALLGRLLAQLGLPDPEGVPVPSARSAQAQRAAESRWNRRGQGA
ncbi:P27 family phage terminase small subunit [Kribbella shirazensis]|uniref:P27 family predicted phage terminase small subunit n=1 Tax=Kribbella shirazensis TaxID=1105143 RepID=A0A7X5VBD2_9ACTN|nr:P27 family phage terminase small subunit [Kribbella shirazensis]NIK57899.1 P27 family predicted phage terminase small subunit [Kribbella shirazensis]